MDIWRTPEVKVWLRGAPSLEINNFGREHLDRLIHKLAYVAAIII